MGKVDFFAPNTMENAFSFSSFRIFTKGLSYMDLIISMLTFSECFFCIEAQVNMKNLAHDMHTLHSDFIPCQVLYLNAPFLP